MKVIFLVFLLSPSCLTGLGWIILPEFQSGQTVHFLNLFSSSVYIICIDTWVETCFTLIHIVPETHGIRCISERWDTAIFSFVQVLSSYNCIWIFLVGHLIDIQLKFTVHTWKQKQGSPLVSSKNALKRFEIYFYTKLVANNV